MSTIARTHFSLFLLMVVLSAKVQAEALFSLSLEELLDISIASRKEQREVDAPSVVSIITAAEIQQFGARNLRDVLDRVVNTQVIGSNLYPHNRVSMRGVTQTHTDNKVLLMLNGAVLRDGNQGGINSDIYNFLPLAAIRKIEIIRGPGSVIYGTNAFSGAINIITYDGSSDKTRLEASAGSFDSYGSGLLYSRSAQNKGFSLALNYQDAEGDKFNNVRGEFGSSGTYPMDKHALQLLSSGHYEELNFNFLYADSSQGNVKSLFQFPASTLDITRTHLALAYLPQLSESWSLDLRLTHNYQEVAFDISNTRSTRTDSQDSLLELIAHGNIHSDFDVLLGLVVENIAGTIGNNTDTPNPFDTTSLGGFVQGTWNVDDQNHLTLGLQQNKPEGKAGKLSPRLAYIHHFNNEWTFKGLYGQAYRSPFGTDMYLDSPTLQGNPDLKPEIIRTLDLQLLKKSEKSYTGLTVYVSRHADLHDRQIINNVPTFVNSGKMRYSGIEIENRLALSDEVDIVANGSYQTSASEAGTNVLSYSPQLMLKLGISFNAGHGIQYGLYENYFSDPVLPDNSENSPSIFNKTPAEYHLVTLNILINLQKVLNNSLYTNTKLSFYVDNLLDQEIYFPSINRSNVNSLPHHAGRGIYLSLSRDF